MALVTLNSSSSLENHTDNTFFRCILGRHEALRSSQQSLEVVVYECGYTADYGINSIFCPVIELLKNRSRSKLIPVQVS